MCTQSAVGSSKCSRNTDGGSPPLVRGSNLDILPFPTLWLPSLLATLLVVGQFHLRFGPLWRLDSGCMRFVCERIRASAEQAAHPGSAAVEMAGAVNDGENPLQLPGGFPVDVPLKVQHVERYAELPRLGLLLKERSILLDLPRCCLSGCRGSSAR
ncbi:hypothetical protein LZ32DRAFT_115478 [Colletotrichum eremochloae]|nr:hypothetical protein LZ32DRAFT_115478 [Colletotrichum eremochloae]